MPYEFNLDLCFIREHTPSPFRAVIEQQLGGLFTGKGTWYIDYKVEEGLDIAVAEVKGLAVWESEEELIRFLKENTETDPTFELDCWEYLQGYQVKVSPKINAGCCRVKTR